MTDDDTGENERNSLFESIARGLLPDEEAREEFDDQMDQIAPNASGTQLDSAISGVLTGAIIGVDAQTQREAVRMEAEAADQPIVHARERELQDGTIAVKIYVSEPNARAFRGDRSVLIIVGEWRDETFLGFEPGNIEKQQGDGETDTVTEFMVYPKDYLPPEPEPEPETEDEAEELMDEMEEISDIDANEIAEEMAIEEEEEKPANVDVMEKMEDEDDEE